MYGCWNQLLFRHQCGKLKWSHIHSYYDHVIWTHDVDLWIHPCNGPLKSKNNLESKLTGFLTEATWGVFFTWPRLDDRASGTRPDVLWLICTCIKVFFLSRRRHPDADHMLTSARLFYIPVACKNVAARSCSRLQDTCITSDEQCWDFLWIYYGLLNFLNPGHHSLKMFVRLLQCLFPVKLQQNFVD